MAKISLQRCVVTSTLALRGAAPTDIKTDSCAHQRSGGSGAARPDGALYRAAPGLPRAVHWTRPGNRRQIMLLSHAVAKFAQLDPSCVLACCSHALTALFRTRETDHPRAVPAWKCFLQASCACASIAGVTSIIIIAPAVAAAFRVNVSAPIFFLLNIVSGVQNAFLPR